ncbi:unnamed protein product [Paramecium primaurelia]|uniref:Uncharacterized protein n=1 Tax=Paramecium primaurelia TaxID=5886 RepID=A0A8S1MGE6_PARPR|nr:unnamed protein product [Paramecium primaurelia]
MIQYNQLLNQNQPTIHQQHIQKINFSLFNTHIQIQMVKFHFNFLINFNFYFTINSYMIFPQNMSFISNYFLQTSLIIYCEAQYSSILFPSFTNSSFFIIQYLKCDHFNCYYMKGINQYNFKFQPFLMGNYYPIHFIMLKYCQQLTYI